MSIDTDAPVITRDEIVIDAPAERIWAIQTDVDAWPQWQPSVDSASCDGPLAPGSSFRWQTAGLDITSTVVSIDAPRRIEWGGPANGITAVHVWTLTPTENGVRVRAEESWRRAPIDAAPEQMQLALDASLREWLHRLKARAEIIGAERG